MFKQIDKEDMFGAIWNFPENLSDALKLGNKIEIFKNYNDVKSVVIAGMGGSAIGGDVISILENSEDINIEDAKLYKKPILKFDGRIKLESAELISPMNS